MRMWQGRESNHLSSTPRTSLTYPSYCGSVRLGHYFLKENILEMKRCLVGSTYKVSFRGHADKDEVITNSNFLSLGSLFGSRMYGPPTGFSYINAPWVSHCFMETSVPKSVPHSPFSWEQSLKHTCANSRPQFLFSPIPARLSYHFHFFQWQENRVWERVVESRNYRSFWVFLIHIEKCFHHRYLQIFKNWLHGSTGYLHTFIFCHTLPEILLKRE